MISGHNILCLSTHDWGGLWTRKQRFMQRLARQGNRVLYIEAQASIVSLRIIKRDWRRIFRWLRGPRKIDDNLYVATLPLVLPFFQISILINKINNWFILRLLKYWLKKLDFKEFVLWTYAPYSDGLAKRIGEKLTIYECVDEFSDSKGLVKPDVVRTLEKHLIEKADLVIVTHENLYKSKKSLAKNIYLIPNGAEVNHFKKSSLPETPIASEMEGITKPIIGFLGAIQYWIDLDLVRHIALSRPQWSIVLIGPVGRLAKTKKIKNLGNIHLLGRIDYANLPSYIKAWDVCINPYVLDGTSQNCSPLKLYEYLAAGKPIVSVDMPEARKFDGLVGIGLDYEDFVEKIDQVLKCLPEDPSKVTSRIQAVEDYSWDKLFSKLERVVEPYL